jgi:hypothetical protein
VKVYGLWSEADYYGPDPASPFLFERESDAIAEMERQARAYWGDAANRMPAMRRLGEHVELHPFYVEPIPVVSAPAFVPRMSVRR